MRQAGVLAAAGLVALDEMCRVLRAGGVAVILETMTTGSETPAPPTEGLAVYYRWLEDERGFSSTIARTSSGRVAATATLVAAP